MNSSQPDFVARLRKIPGNTETLEKQGAGSKEDDVDWVETEQGGLMAEHKYEDKIRLKKKATRISALTTALGSESAIFQNEITQKDTKIFKLRNENEEYQRRETLSAMTESLGALLADFGVDVCDKATREMLKRYKENPDGDDYRLRMRLKGAALNVAHELEHHGHSPLASKLPKGTELLLPQIAKLYAFLKPYRNRYSHTLLSPEVFAHSLANPASYTANLDSERRKPPTLTAEQQNAIACKFSDLQRGPDGMS
ncbi:hypothetical protein IAT38_007208 [Cryptococcus sp. DSM 104549]